MIHPTQSQILKQLKSSTSSRFNELKPSDMTSDHFNFHVKRLLEQNLIDKHDDGSYALTVHGKSFANKLDDTQKDSHSKKEQPKISVLFIVQKVSNGIVTYVAKRRKQHPFYDHLVFPTWGLQMGITLAETTSTHLPHISGLSGTPQLIGQIRRLDKDPESGAIVNDIILMVTLITDATGTLTADHHGAEQTWVTKQQMLADNKLTGIPPHVFNMIEDSASPRLVELEFIIQEGRF